MQREIRAFLDDHPDGWSHQAWSGFLDRLRAEGYDTSDPDAIGHRLEGARLARFLEHLGVHGLGPRRREALVDRFGTLWKLRHAGEEEIGGTPGITAPLAREIRGALG